MSEAPPWIRELFTAMPADVEAVPSGEGCLLRIRRKQPGHYLKQPLGTPNALRFAAAHRYEPFWMKPAVGMRMQEIPIETQLLFLELPNDRIALVVPLCHGGWRCSLEGTEQGLTLVAETGSEHLQLTDVLAAAYVALGTRTRLHELTAESAKAVADILRIPLREAKPLPAFINDFGWCTWDAFYQEVSHENVREGLGSFRSIGIQPKFLILDDGWQSEESFGDEKGRRLIAFAPNAKFSGDLSPTTRMAKEEFGIRTFLVWHAFQGYWSGASSEHLPQYHPQEIARSYGPGILHYLPEFNTKWWGSTAGIVTPGLPIERFYKDYHRTLAAQGVDGVKVDNQAALEAFSNINEFGRTGLYAYYHDALEESVRLHFPSSGSPLINCMSCANDLLYSYKHSALTRTSGDFYPQHDHLHGLHLWTNAFVATWFGHFIHPDWDMFHSRHPFASFHAAARAISGGPIYVSDKPNHHNPDLLRKLVLSDGTVLRCDHPATLTADALFTDPTRDDAPLKIWNTTRLGHVGMLGLFNCRQDAQRDIRITAAFRPSDIPLLPTSDHYALYHHRTQTLETITRDEERTITLAQKEWELLTIVPIRKNIAVIGLLDKLIGSAAVVEEHNTSTALHLRIRDRGTLGIYMQHPPAGIVAGTKTIPYRHEGELLTVEVDVPGEQQITIYWNTSNPP